MKLPITLPQLGLSEAVVVVEWLRSDGDQVAAGEPLVTLETEKAQTEVESPGGGRLEIAIPAGPDMVPSGAVLGYVIPPPARSDADQEAG